MRPAWHSRALLVFGVTVCLALALPSPLLAQAAPPTTQKEQLLEQHLINGTVEFGRKNYEGALKEFLAAQEADPTDFYASFFLGVTYLRLKQYEQAVQTLRQAHELKPDAIEVYLPLGETYYSMKEYQAALPFLEKAREAEPDNPHAHFFLGSTYFQLGDYEKVHLPLQRAAELDPTLRQSAEFMRGASELLSGRLGEGRELFLEAQRIDPKTALAGFSAQFARGIELQERALKRFSFQKEQLLEQHLINGTVEFGRKNYEGALKEFLAAQEADPTDFYASFFLGVTYLRLKQYEQAVQTLRQAHELKPDAIEVYLPLGETYYSMKEYQAALPFLEKAREAEPDNPHAHFFLGSTYFQLGDYEKVHLPLQRAAELDPTLRQSAEFMRGASALISGRLGEARELFREAQRIEPKTDLAGFSEQFIRGIELQERALKRFSFHVSSGFGFDTNVRQILSDMVTNNDSTVSMYEAGFRAQPIMTPRFTVGMGYTFLEQIPHELEELDVQGHVGYLFANIRVGPFWLAPQYVYTYYTLDTQSFLQIHSIKPTFIIPLGNTFTQLYYEFQDQEFFTIRLRNGSVHALGVTELVSFWNNRARLEIGYRAEEEVTTGDDFDRAVHTIAGSLTLPAPLGTQMQIQGHWRFKDYFNTHSIFGVERDEEEQLIAGYLSRKFGNYTTITAGWQYLNNNSNVAFFDMNKNYYVMELALDF